MQETTPSKRYRVYRNLNNGKLSVKEVGGNVCGYVSNIYLHDVKLVCSEKGRDRVRAEGVKNVHAYIEGYVSQAYNFTSREEREIVVTPETDRPPVGGFLKAYYNPYTCDFWTDKITGKVLKPDWSRCMVWEDGTVRLL